MREKEKKEFSVGFVIGLLVMIAGALLLLGTFGFPIHFDIKDYWPVLLMVVGLAKILQPRHGHQIFWGFVLLLLGVAFQLKNLDIIYFRFHDLWPFVLIIIGYHIARGSVRRTSRYRAACCRAAEDPAGQGPVAQNSETVDQEVVHVHTTLGGGRYTYLNKKLKGGDISVFMGGVALDLRQTDMEGPEIVMDVRVFMGGIEIFVPIEWEVVLQGSPVMGGIENKTRPVPAPLKRLIVKGSGMMGSIEVKN